LRSLENFTGGTGLRRKASTPWCRGWKEKRRERMKKVIEELEKEIPRWRDAVKKLSYYKIREAKGEDEAKKQYNEAKEILKRSRGILKNLSELRDLKTQIAEPPWGLYYKDDMGMVRFYFYYNPLDPGGEAPTKSLQINLEFWEDGTVKVFFLPSKEQEIIKMLAEKIGLSVEDVKRMIEKFLETKNYKEIISRYHFTSWDGKDVDDVHGWAGKIFSVETVSPENIVDSLRGARELFDLYKYAIQEVLSARKFRRED